MDSKQKKILISGLLLLWSFVISAAGFYVMGYMSDFSFGIKWLLNFLLATPPIIVLQIIGGMFKKKV